jgi:hypothetical protein
MSPGMPMTSVPPSTGVSPVLADGASLLGAPSLGAVLGAVLAGACDGAVVGVDDDPQAATNIVAAANRAPNRVRDMLPPPNTGIRDSRRQVAGPAAGSPPRRSMILTVRLRAR